MADAIAIANFSASQLRTIKNSVAKDTDATEFDLFMEACKSYRLDPFRKQIHAVVYGKDNPRKRKMSIIVSRDGLRVLAQRCNDYRPASEKADIVYDDTMKGPTNPKGIVSATVRLWKQDNRGEWFPVIGEAYWDEFAPVKDEWAEGQDGRRRPTGNKVLDASGNWAKMPIVMITKCAESQALRAGWPDQFGNIYSEEEMDRMGVEQSATEALANYEREQREALVGGPGIMMVFDETATLEKVEIGKVYDRVCEFLRTASPEEAMKFKARNVASLQDFWSQDKAAALDLKEKLEAKEREFAKQIEAA